MEDDDCSKGKRRRIGKEKKRKMTNRRKKVRREGIKREWKISGKEVWRK